MSCKQKKKTGPSSPLTFHFFSHIFSLTIIFCVTSPCLSHLTNSNVTLLSNTLRWLSQTLPMSIRCSGTVLFCFFCLFGFFTLIHLCRSYSLCQSVSLSHALINIYLFWLPHSSHTFRLSCLQNSGHKDCDVQYAELDTAALASSPSPRSSAHTGPGDLVEYATIQPSSH